MKQTICLLVLATAAVAICKSVLRHSELTVTSNETKNPSTVDTIKDQREEQDPLAVYLQSVKNSADQNKLKVSDLPNMGSVYRSILKWQTDDMVAKETAFTSSEQRESCVLTAYRTMKNETDSAVEMPDRATIRVSHKSHFFSGKPAARIMGRFLRQNDKLADATHELVYFVIAYEDKIVTYIEIGDFSKRGVYPVLTFKHRE